MRCTICRFKTKKLGSRSCRLIITQVAYGLGPLDDWSRGFESHSNHGFMSASFCVVLMCDGSIPSHRSSTKVSETIRSFQKFILNRNGGEANP